MSLNSTEGISLNFHWWYDLGDRLMGLKGRGQIRHTIRREKLRDFMSSNWVEVPDIFCFEFDFCSLIDPGCFFLSPTVISLIALVCRQLHNCSLLSHKQLMSGPTSSYNRLRTWMFCRCRRYTWLKSCQFLIDIRHSHSATGGRQSGTSTAHSSVSVQAYYWRIKRRFHPTHATQWMQLTYESQAPANRNRAVLFLAKLAKV